jgi:hypothetical protein
MASAGVPDLVADRCYKFALIACGRVFLSGLGVQFAREYFCLSGEGELVETGLIEEEPYVAATMSFAQEHPASRALARFALLSADVAAVNGALRAGAEAGNLVIGPAALFLEPATAEGMARAEDLIAAHWLHRRRNGRNRGGNFGSSPL